MADAFADEQRQLGQAWKKARKDGCLAPWQQARVYGLSEAWAEIHGETTDITGTMKIKRPVALDENI